MAVPIAPNCGTMTCPAPDSLLLVSVLLTALYAIIFSFTLFCFPEGQCNREDSKESTTTPINTKRRTDPVCPDAPKATKRQRIGDSPSLSSVSRKLFADEAVCPDAPKKVTKRKQNKRRIASVATHLDFSDEAEQTTETAKPIQIKDIRTKPNRGEKLSPETETVCSFYKPHNTIIPIEDALNADADAIDPTNPDRKKPNVSVVDIINYILTLNRMIQNLQVLNINRVALPHFGDGELTTRDDEYSYYLIDKLFNASYNTNNINEQLSNILANIYQKNKGSWTTIPDTYAHACQLCRDATILGAQLQREVSYNMNLTPWSDW